MCTFQLDANSTVHSCRIAGYFTSIPDDNLEANSILKRESLPIDKDGLCIFHSRDIDWKLKGKFHKWMDALTGYLRYLNTLRNKPTSNGHNRIVNLTGVFLIGKETKLQTGSKETAIKIRKLRLDENIEIKIDYAEIADQIRFEECLLKNTQISFNKTTVNGELIITNTALGQLSFNDSNLNGGILMNKCEFAGYTELSGMKISNIFEVRNVLFSTSAFFTSSNFRCESVYFDHVTFGGKADFGLATFHGDVNFEECTFSQLLTFSNAAFYGPLAFTGNLYEDNVQFTSNERKNKVFYDNVNFTFIDKEEEVRQQFLFDNVNYYLIGAKERIELAELARLNKVVIGSGCIKYRIQTQPIIVSTNDINKNIAKELAHSFTNYFTSSTGKNLGVEFIDNTINSVSLFYFSDEDISEEEFLKRLKIAEKNYWTSGVPDGSDQSPEETLLKVDNYVSKAALLIKMSMLWKYSLWQDSDTIDILRAINFDPNDDKSGQINFIIHKYSYMNIEKIIAQPNSQVNIADRIDNIAFNQEATGISRKEIEMIKTVLVQLNEAELTDIQGDVNGLAGNTTEISKLEKIKEKLNGFATRHGIPLIDGIAASGIYEILKAIFH